MFLQLAQKPADDVCVSATATPTKSTVMTIVATVTLRMVTRNRIYRQGPGDGSWIWLRWQRTQDSPAEWRPADAWHERHSVRPGIVCQA